MTTVLDHLEELEKRARIARSQMARGVLTEDGITDALADISAIHSGEVGRALPALLAAARALGECQKTLSILIDPANKGSGISNMAAWASCVASEGRARAAIAPLMKDAK